ncbi:MAG: superoxide dismutase [Patescibacteria group bacterium]|nr:superoxide dismutase [Patescibacteria group bacterium]
MLNFLNLPFLAQDFSGKISSETFDFHYGKHHRAYFDNLLKLISGTDLENYSLEEIIKKSFSQDNLRAVFNNSAQVFNHDFYWQSLTPKKKEPSKFLLKKIIANFSSLDNFKGNLKKVALGQFGSGWVWVILDKGEIKIISTSNADTPIAYGIKPLLTIDVWEHAYYIDHRNNRAGYLDLVINDLINWDFFEDNLK